MANSDGTPKNEKYLSVNVDEVVVGELLPTRVYLYIDARFITFRDEGDSIDGATRDRLALKGVKNLFILDRDRGKFDQWSKQVHENVQPAVEAVKETSRELTKARADAHRTLMDIFTNPHSDKAIAQAIETSKRMVDEVMKVPYAVRSLSSLQTYSQGTIDHSVNVSVLSTYLAMQIGYNHNVILQHLGLGALLHDLGKTLVKVEEGETDEQIEAKMLEHPTLGVEALTAQGSVPQEVKLIVAQHHEAHDGSGYPKKLKGGAIYDLARIVAIANTFDELVGDSSGPLVERQRKAIQKLDQELSKKFDPQKLDKCLKILKMGV